MGLSRGGQKQGRLDEGGAIYFHRSITQHEGTTPHTPAGHRQRCPCLITRQLAPCAEEQATPPYHAYMPRPCAWSGVALCVVPRCRTPLEQGYARPVTQG
ncbi:hypothetical protein AAFF_G00015130 [Aldrovandia affinis]|uniref:Uncharacterized protein n=1 Tax=Aldrovandia affinis TaxID=143900 RepID=A0AAD7WHD5_9TELE|nr:hypothetical protein AAFF_G00015130 [Aldrovandia affinis]